MAMQVSRRSLLIVVVSVVALGVIWSLVGAVVQPRTLATYREDYENAKFARNHPRLVRLVKEEEAVRAAEVFARDYERLEESGIILAPIRSAAAAISHDKYESMVNPSEREKFEQERKERERKQAEQDAERLREIREKEQTQRD